MPVPSNFYASITDCHLSSQKAAHHVCQCSALLQSVHDAGACAINVYINYERKFAFVELRTGEVAFGA